MTKEDWFSILTSLHDMHVGHHKIDEAAWMEDFESGKSPHDAFFDEYPDYSDILD